MGRAFSSLGELGTFVEQRGASITVVDPGVPLQLSNGAIDGIWASQPSVRKVVDFIACQVASTPMHVYERVSDEDRRRVTDHPLARLLVRPVASTEQSAAITAFRFWHSIVVDWLLRDRWAAARLQVEGEPYLQRIPARRFTLKQDGLDRVTGIVVHDDRGRAKEESLAGFVWDAGYTDPGARGKYHDGGAGTSPMITLAQLLAEYEEAVRYRRAVWKRGARVPAVIERPTAWPSDGKAYERFKNDWRAFMRGGGDEGGTPVLEDGMKLSPVNAFNPKETQDLEGRQLTDIEVCSFFHIAPELLGVRQGNYANMDAFRQGLYRESLGPYYFQLAEVINLHLVPDLSGGKPLYVEHALDAKLAGSFIEQAQVYQAAVGAPYMLRAEARARLNLPKVPGADRLVTPLNVLEGGQASPQDSGSQNAGPLKDGPARTKTQAPETYVKKAQQVLAKFWKHQADVILPKLGAKADAEWWDAERWDAELAGNLYPLQVSITKYAGRETLEALGYDPDTYDVDRTLAYQTEVAKTSAKNMNAITLAQLEEALDDDEEPLAAVAHVFEVATTSRAELAGAAVAVSAAAWGSLEAGRQVGNTTKTWITGDNPRPEHAAMDGETVPVDQPFSNGSMWPGDGQDGEYGCNCSIEITVA